MATKKSNTEELKEMLLERKRRLWAELREEVFERGAGDLHSQYDIPQDLGESSLLDVLADAGLAVADVRREELTRLEEAERKLEMGSYGICEECGEEIGTERLKLIPYASYCVRCQTEREPKPPAARI